MQRSDDFFKIHLPHLQAAIFPDVDADENGACLARK